MNPVFLIHTYCDQVYARRLLNQTRKAYPSATILLISDGDRAEGLQQFCQQRRVIFMQGDRLKRRESGGMWVQRFLMAAQNFQSDPLIKLDADSYMNRAFSHWPDEGYDLAGTVIEKNGLRIVRGGCVAYSKVAIAKILDSQSLKSPRFATGADYYYRRYQHYRLPNDPPVSGEAIASEDAIMAFVAHELNLSQTSWPEVAIAWREPLPPDVDKFAVIHPVRSI